MKSQNSLEVKDLKKSYGSSTALKSVSLSIKHGESVALLGANGAGKTTFTKIIMGILQPCSGSIQVLGRNPNDFRLKSEVSYLPQYLEFPEHLKVREVIKLIEQHYKSPRNQDLLKRLDMTKLLNKFCCALSGGERRKIGLLLTLIGDCPFVILDEPTSNIDLASRMEIYDSLREFKKGKTLIFSSHEISEIKNLADRVVILHQGRVVTEGRIEEIQAQFGIKKVSLETPAKNLSLSSATKILKEENHTTIYGPNSDDIIKEIIKQDCPFTNLKISSTSLEEIFNKIWSQP